MRPPRLLTPAERRLTLLLLVLTLLGVLDRGARRLDPEVLAWLEDLEPLESPEPGELPEPAPEPATIRAPATPGTPRVESRPGAADDSTGGDPPRVEETGRASSGFVGIDPNTASERELQDLPGIGPALAARIAASRREEGPFRTPEDLLRVRGIGPATLARLRSRLAFP